MNIGDLSRKEIYTICKDLDFDTKKIKDFCIKKNIDYIEFENGARYYSKNYLSRKIIDFSENEMKFTYESTNLYSIIQKYKKFIIGRNIIFRYTYPIYEIYDTLKKELLKLFISFNFDKKKIEELLLKFGLDFQKHVEIVARYIINQDNKAFLYGNIDELLKSIRPLTNKSLEPIPVFYQKLLEAKTREDIVWVIENSIQNPENQRIYDFALKYHKNEFEKVEKDIKNKLVIYNEYKKEKRKQELKQKNKNENSFEEAINTIKLFINSEFESVEDFCNEYNININKFKTYINTVKEQDSNLYNLYIKKTTLIKQKNYAIIISICKNIIDNIKNGVSENGEIRPFDLLDYYRTTTYDRTTILKVLKDVAPPDAKLFITFLRKYPNSILLDSRKIKEILNSKQVIGIEFDKDGKPIVGSGHEITIEEKEYVINYLKDNNIPLYDDVYNIALRRYINGNLVLEKDNVKVKSEQDELKSLTRK